MSLKYLSTYGILVALVSIGFTAMTIVVEFRYIQRSHVKDWMRDYSPVFAVGILSLILLVGIFKKSCWLTLPAFLYGLGGSIYAAYILFGEAIEYERVSKFVLPSMLLGLEIIVLYPMFHLFLELYRAKPSKKRHIIEPTTTVPI